MNIKRMAAGVSALAALGIAVAGPAVSAGAAADGTGTDAAYFAVSLNGGNEVPTPGGPAAGDKDGTAVAYLQVSGDEIRFAAAFKGIAAPATGTIQAGAKGENGAVEVTLFTAPAYGNNGTATGTVRVKDAQFLADLKANPRAFHLDIATPEFPGGAVRGQVNGIRSTLDMDHALQRDTKASVTQGVQIYACTVQPDGSFAFTQDNVRATLDNGISHFFANPGPAGPPEWLARDRSAVTGKVLARTPNGTGNIAELDLAATQAGRPFGLLAGTDEILRLNTVGGVAPSGPCDPAAQARVEVPYRADYVFLDSTQPIV
ncbi:CHRD domain-containing protein [Yinghuangia seranimata]|uniref:CHRD domain-containing protein n=1 Tax=Yinghuangia seranimata TaxID=408067 RepID=UPI00248AD687|nr:CHRD domain-containing protein [Yinghuangia seranimata]MDI2129965.1 DUF3455 domain-containing protein [Yinghuangia seranimata]MDI2131643.1 DUF3455 domain-containing protein [Yinghuangia seranimata]